MRNIALFILTGAALYSFALFIIGCNEQALAMTKPRILYQAKCSSCHRTLSPKDYDQKTWAEYVQKYGEKLDREQKNLILLYHSQNQK